MSRGAESYPPLPFFKLTVQLLPVSPAFDRVDGASASGQSREKLKGLKTHGDAIGVQ